MSAPSTRRNFLKATATAAAVAPWTALGQDATGDPIRIGLIGCGGRCTGAAMNAMNAGPDVRLTAMCDVFAERVQSSLSNLTKQRPAQVDVPTERQFVGFDGYRKVIEASDVVLIACASKFHPRYALEALKAGRHVFVEKPHGIDPAGMGIMRQAIALARKKKLCLVSGLHSRYSTAFQEGVRRIHDGAIGEVVAVEENFLRGPYRLESRRPADEEMHFQFRNWYHFSWLSGDDVTQSLVHNLDRTRAVLKEAVPLRCYGLGGRSSMFTEQMGDVFDHHSVTYEFPGGVRVYAHCRTQTGCYNNSSSLVMGTRGRALLTGNSYALIGPDGKRVAGESGATSPYDEEHRALFAAVREGRSLVNDYMVDSTQTTVMGQIACYTGGQVSWKQVAASEALFGPAYGDFTTSPPKSPGPDGTYALAVPGTTRIL